MSNKDLNNLVSLDNNIKLKQLSFFENSKDIFHVERKKQQRAISFEMILIALNYGCKKRSFQDTTYTLTDRKLLNTIYEKYLSKLRGLTIVGNWVDSNFVIITCFWNYTIKCRKKY